MYQTIDNCVEGRSGINTLVRPDDLNTIVPRMREELENAVAKATRDRAVKAIISAGGGTGVLRRPQFLGRVRSRERSDRDDGDAGRDLS